MAKRYCIPDPSLSVTDRLIMDHIERNRRVIDLGCGDGRLMEKLRDEHGCSVQGVELNVTQIQGAIARGVPVIHADLDQGLNQVPNDSFDYAVLSQTLQQVAFPKLLLEEMLRVAQRALVVLPNFGHWRVRRQLLFQGRAPVTAALPYEWYNSPNRHFMTIRDFRDLVETIKVGIAQEIPIINNRAVDRAWAANFRADSVLYVLEKMGNR